LFCMPPVLHR